MDESFLNGRVVLHPGDCLNVLAQLEECSVDSCVTDPPYHLTSIVQRFGGEDRKAWEAINGNHGGGVSPYSRTSVGFMGKVWDGGDVAFDPATWRAVFRVLKPGGHLLAMGGTRTFHRLACAIEDAGFEIRDTISWLYGSGFPKSHSVGNGWGTALKPACELIVLARKPLSEGTVAANVLRWGTGAINVDGCRIGTTKDVPASAQKDRIGQIAKGDEHGRTMDTSGFDPNVGRWPANLVHDGSDEVTAAFPDTELSRGRRSGDNSIFGTLTGKLRGFTAGEIGYGDSGSAARFFYTAKADAGGRWPANVAHDGSEEVVAAFPEVHGAGHARDGSSNPRQQEWSCNVPNAPESRSTGDMFRFGDSGSAARFFYTSKADADDRLGSKHPTVKPLDLMQWLVRLVTPKGGTVLDPFAGTGTTGEAAWREGMRTVLIEAEPEYQADIRRRMALALAGPDERSRESIKAKNLPRDDGPLFSRETWAEMWAKPFDWSQEPKS